MDEGKSIETIFLQGTTEELEILIERYGGGLFQYCYNILCDYHEAQDAVQTVFVKVFQNYSKFSGKSALSTWLYRIAYNQCVDILRHKKKYLLFGSKENEQSQEMYIPVDNYRTEILAAIKKLTPKERAVLYCRAVEDKNYKELSAVFRLPESTLRKQYERARKKMLKELECCGLEYERVNV